MVGSTVHRAFELMTYDQSMEPLEKLGLNVSFKVLVATEEN